MGLERHEVHDLEVWYPQFGEDVHIDGGHAELVLPALPPLLPEAGPVSEVTEHGGLQSPVLPLHIEISIQRDGEILVRHLQCTSLYTWQASLRGITLGISLI